MSTEQMPGTTGGRRVLVAGASGTLGREVVRSLREQGDRVRTFSRHPERARALSGMADEVVTGDATDPRSLVGVMDGVDAVVSCIGAPMVLQKGGDRRSFRAVDTVANVNLVGAAADSGVGRFVYVSVLLRPGWSGTAYARAHEDVVDVLRSSGMDHAVVRLTGMFPNFDLYLGMARRGVAWIAGDGRPLTNPIHPADAAEACVEALAAPSGTSVEAGGPETLAREDIVRLAFRAMGREARIVHVPPALLFAAARALRPVNPHLGEFVQFGTAAFTHDFVAPSRGRHRIGEHFRAPARA